MCILDDSPLQKLYNNKTYIDENTNYNFLDDLKKYKDIDKLYNMLDDQDDQTIKNIYNYILLKWNKINNLNGYKYVRTMNQSIFNTYMNDFINKELYKSIYILNSIIVYLIH